MNLGESNELLSSINSVFNKSRSLLGKSEYPECGQFKTAGGGQFNQHMQQNYDLEEDGKDLAKRIWAPVKRVRR